MTLRARAGAAAALAGVCLALPASARAQSEQALQRKARQELEAWNQLAPYLELVAAYRAGETARAIAGVSQGSQPLVKTVFESLDTLGDRVCLCRQTDAAIACRAEAGQIEVVDLDAAVMLHTDAAIDRLDHRDVHEFEVQLSAARRLLEWVRDTTQGWSRDPRNLPPGCRPAPDLAPRDWYVAVSEALVGYGEFGAAEVLARRGLELAPDDPALLLILGTIVESAPRPARSTHGLGYIGPHGLPARSAARGPRAAEPFFEQAVAADPGLLEARLRLGRVLALRHRPDEASVELRRVLAQSTDGRQRYLAALFLGRVLEDEGQADAAAASYRRAIAAWPDGQSARIALVHLMARRGQAAGALSLLRETLGRPWWPYQMADPWWSYTFRPFTQGRALLGALRRQVVIP